jgi:hypothetical protein
MSLREDRHSWKLQGLGRSVDIFITYLKALSGSHDRHLV